MTFQAYLHAGRAWAIEQRRHVDKQTYATWTLFATSLFTRQLAIDGVLHVQCTSTEDLTPHGVERVEKATVHLVGNRGQWSPRQKEDLSQRRHPLTLESGADSTTFKIHRNKARESPNFLLAELFYEVLQNRLLLGVLP